MSQLLPNATIQALRRKRRRSKEIVTSVKLTRKLNAALKAEARKQDRPQSFIIREALLSYLNFRQGRVE